MPRYLYKCPKCSGEFEVEKSMAAVSRPEPCPRCQTQGDRVFTAPALGGQNSPDFSKNEAPGGCTNCCPGGTCGLN